MGPTNVWCAIALAIAEDREQDSNLFIEDANSSIPGKTEKERNERLKLLMEKIATSIVRCGDNSDVKYKKIFIGYRSQWIPEGHVGCALTCAPYIVLAKNAVPVAGPEALLSMSISDWEKEKGF